MLGLKTKIVAAVIIAILSGLLLASTSYVFFPNQPSGQMPAPKPSASWADQLCWTTLWMGLALLAAFAVVGVVMLANLIRKSYGAGTALA